MWRHLWPDAPETARSATSPTACTPRAGSGPRCARSTRATWTRTGRTTSSSPSAGTRVREIPDAELWAAHRSQKERLIRFVRERVRLQSARHGRSPDELRGVEGLLDPRALTIGFARRFATYKRAVLVLSDLDRAARAPQRPRAAGADPLRGQGAPRRPRRARTSSAGSFLLTQGEFRGKLVFLEDYDMEVGRMLVQGCDVWLNTPRRPAGGQRHQRPEVAHQRRHQPAASSTAGGRRATAATTAGPSARRRRGRRADDQDRADAASLYRLLEEEVVPLFFEQDAGRPAPPLDRDDEGVDRVRGPAVQRAPHGARLRREDIYLPAAARS